MSPPSQCCTHAAVCVCRSTREVEITEASTSESVLQSVGAAPQDHYLLEKGGNIGTRRLHPRTRMFAVLKVNPDATLAVCKV